MSLLQKLSYLDPDFKSKVPRKSRDDSLTRQGGVKQVRVSSTRGFASRQQSLLVDRTPVRPVAAVHEERRDVFRGPALRQPPISIESVPFAEDLSSS